MAAGDIIIPDNTITPELLDKIAAEVQNRLSSTSKDPGQYEEVDSLTGITSIPVFQQSGSTYKLVRVLLSILKGVDGKEVHLQSTETHLQWRWTDGMWNNLIAWADLKGDPGETPVFRSGPSGIEWKYESEEEAAWKVLVTFDALKLKFSDLTAEQIAAFWQVIPEDVLVLFQKPATDAATEVREQMTQISQEVNQAITDTNAAKDAANTAAVNAKSVSDHPGYIGNDYHVYTWDYVTGAYNKTDTVLRPEGFSIYRTYATIAAMNADLSNVPEGKFVLINTGSVDDEDTAKLYVKGAANFEYLVDMSGAIGFTGKTPQITIGTVTVGSSASASLPPDGTDDNGNPKFKLNLVIVAGPQGLTPIIEMGTTTTGQPGTDAVATLAPNGQTSDGRDKYLLNLTIPQGLPGTGSGNVLVPGPGLVSGKKYLFVPSGNDSTVGTFVEYVVPEAYDDTEVRRLIGEKVDKVVGKQLTTEDFTTLLKQKLEGLTNYNDATLTAELNNLKARLDALIGTSASAAIDTFNEITAFLAGITDTQSLTTLLSGLRTDIVALIPTKTSDLTNDSGFVSDASYVHTDNNYTTTDKNKLSGIAASANNYVHPTTAGNKHIPAGGTSGQILRWSADGTAVWGVDNDTTYSPATETTNGLMSSDDKTKLDRIGSYTTATTVANLNANYENIEVSLNANASLSVNAAGRNYDGLEMNVLVYCPSTRTITIPTSGNYESMCGSSHTCPAGRRVEFNLKCYVGIWHIAKLEQQ